MGGDPRRLTIFGESAGAFAAGAVIASPLAKGLFHGAILQSGTGISSGVLRRGEAEATGRRLVESLGVPGNGPEAAASLRALEAYRLVTFDRSVVAAAPRKIPAPTPWIVPFAPIVDGWALPLPIDEAITRRAHNDVPVIVGSNADEGTTFLREVFLAPIGYLNAPRATGKSLTHDPDRAPLVRRAFEDYATGQSTKEQLLKQVRTWGLTNRRGRPLTSQAIGVLLCNQLYAGIVDVPEYGLRGKRGDFEPLISEELFYRVQAILSGRVLRTAPRQRAHPDFSLRGFVRCESCGRGLTSSWSKGRALSTEMALRERATRAGLEVALERRSEC